MTRAWTAALAPFAALVLRTVFIMLIGYLAGHLLKRLISRRLASLVRRTPHTWDDAVVSELSRRVPFWTLLVGVYVAAGFWDLPQHVDTTLNKVLIVAGGTSATLMAAAVAAGLVRDYSQRVYGTRPITSLSDNVARIVVVTVGVLTILHSLGVSIAPMLTALGVGGLAVALALQDTLANLFAGIQVTLAQQVRVGDYLRLDSGDEGYLVDIAWRSARLEMINNNVVIVPNGKLAQAIVVNHALPNTDIVVYVPVGVGYDSDLAVVERVCVDEARAVQAELPAGAADVEPAVRFQGFGESGITLNVVLRAREFRDQALIKHELVKRLHARFAREGITIPYPTRTLVAGPGGLVVTRDQAA